MKWLYSRLYITEKRFNESEDRNEESIQNMAQRVKIYKKRRKFLSKDIRRHIFRK